MLARVSRTAVPSESESRARAVILTLRQVLKIRRGQPCPDTQSEGDSTLIHLGARTRNSRRYAGRRFHDGGPPTQSPTSPSRRRATLGRSRQKGQNVSSVSSPNGLGGISAVRTDLEPTRTP